MKEIGSVSIFPPYVKLSTLNTTYTSKTEATKDHSCKQGKHKNFLKVYKNNFFFLAFHLSKKSHCDWTKLH